jgi:hypothetical protein
MVSWKNGSLLKVKYLKFTQLSSFSRFSVKYCWRVGPGWVENDLMIVLVLSYWLGDTIGSKTRRYSFIVCSNGGTGTFGKVCKEKIILFENYSFAENPN